MSERETLWWVLDAAGVIDPTGQLYDRAEIAVDAILAAGFRLIPAQGTPEFEAMVERAFDAATEARPDYDFGVDHEMMRAALLAAFTPGGTDD